MRNTFCAFLKLSPGKENRLSTLYAWQAIFLLYLLPLFYNLPSVNLHRCIAQGCDVFPVMAGQKDGFSFVFQFQKQLPHLLHALVVEAVHGLVQDQKERIFHDRLCNAEALAHTEGIFADVLFRFRVQTDFSDGFVDLFLSDFPADAGKKLQILPCAVSRKEARCFDDSANALRRFDFITSLS